jgi:hypothetical protein
MRHNLLAAPARLTFENGLRSLARHELMHFRDLFFENLHQLMRFTVTPNLAPYESMPIQESGIPDPNESIRLSFSVTLNRVVSNGYRVKLTLNQIDSNSSGLLATENHIDSNH